MLLLTDGPLCTKLLNTLFLFFLTALNTVVGTVFFIRK